jgi:acyl dehydratase
VTPPRAFIDIAGIEAAIGEDLGTTDWVEITRSTVDAFAEVADHQWIHVDVEQPACAAESSTLVVL